MNLDIVKLKEYVKEKELFFFIKDGYIYCEDTVRGERVIVGNYACIELNAHVLKVVYEDGFKKYELNDNKRILRVKEFDNYNFLFSLGFQIRETDGHYVKKVYLNNDNDDRNFYDINPQTREMQVDIQHFFDNTILSLCLGGILE